MAALQLSWLSSLKTTALFSSTNQHKSTLFKVPFSQNWSQSSDEASNPESPNSEQVAPVDPVKLAFEKAKAYKKTKVNPDGDSIPASVKVAMDKTREYKENGSESIIASGKN